MAPPARWPFSLGLVGLLALVALGLCGCASSPGPSAPSAATNHAQPPRHAPKTPTTTTTTTVPEEPGWTTLSTTAGGVAVDERTVTGTDGVAVTVVRFRAPLTRFALHVGSTDPPLNGATVSADAGASISPTEAPVLLAAFNGGFKAATGAGGFEVDGVTLLPLMNGAASLVIDADGTAHVGVWGQDLPLPGEQVVSVRQNLAPLVLQGQPSPQINDIGAWGATLGGVNSIARSALGQDAQGNLLYAASMMAVPADLANALITCGALSAMQLDINPYWVQLDYAPAPGAPLVAGVPGQQRPADQYQTGWIRDFVTVLAHPPGS